MMIYEIKSSRSYDFNDINFAYKDPLDSKAEDEKDYESQSQNFANCYSDLGNEENETKEQFIANDNDEIEDGNDQPYRNKYAETILKLEQEGFFDKNDISEIDICKIRHDLHYAQTLSRRIIYRIDSSSENVASITLKIIDLFLEKADAKIMESLIFNFLANKVFKKHDINIVKEQLKKCNTGKILDNIFQKLNIDIESFEINSCKYF